jgi:hypothetical protein
MKSNMLLTSLFMVCATGSIMSMDQAGKGRLNFQLDDYTCITGYSSHNMGFYVKPSFFMGKSIFDVVPLSRADGEALAIGFSHAKEDKKTIAVPYTLEQKKFVAKITPLIIKDEKLNFFVKIQEAKK